MIVSGRAQHRHDALRLAERIGADQVRAFWEQFDRAQELADFAFGVMVAEHRQSESRLGYKYIARDQFELRACRIGDIFVIAGGNDTQAVAFDADLRRTEHMAGGMEADICAIELHDLAIANRLRAAGEIVAVAQAHDVEGFLCCQDCAMPGARMVGVAMRDQGLFDGPRRVNMETAGLAAHTRRRRNQDIFGTHRV